MHKLSYMLVLGCCNMASCEQCQKDNFSGTSLLSQVEARRRISDRQGLSNFAEIMPEVMSSMVHVVIDP